MVGILEASLREMNDGRRRAGKDPVTAEEFLAMLVSVLGDRPDIPPPASAMAKAE